MLACRWATSLVFMMVHKARGTTMLQEGQAFCSRLTCTADATAAVCQGFSGCGEVCHITKSWSASVILDFCKQADLGSQGQDAQRTYLLPRRTLAAGAAMRVFLAGALLIGFSAASALDAGAAVSLLTVTAASATECCSSTTSGSCT